MDLRVIWPTWPVEGSPSARFAQTKINKQTNKTEFEYNGPEGYEDLLDYNIHFTQSPKLIEQYDTRFNVTCSFERIDDIVQEICINMTSFCSLERPEQEELLSSVQVDCHCWIELANGIFPLNKQFDSEFMDKNERLNKLEAGLYFVFSRDDFERLEDGTKFDETGVVEITFEIELIFSYKRKCAVNSKTILISDIDIVVQKLEFLDHLVEKVKFNSAESDGEQDHIQLISNEKDSISLPLKVVTRFSEMMRCMFIGCPDSERMEEARNLKVHVDPKFTISHLEDFKSLILGSKEDRKKILSSVDVEYFKEIYELVIGNL
jgi:hypothetical protein